MISRSEDIPEDDAVAVEALCAVRPNPPTMPISGMRFDVMERDVPQLSCTVANCPICCASHPPCHDNMLGDSFPTMEPFEVLKECLVGAACAIAVCAAVLGVGFVFAWAAHAYGVSAWVNQAMSDLLRWWLSV